MATEADTNVEELLEKKHVTVEELLEAMFSIYVVGPEALYTGDRNGAAVNG
jgi:hypothetical protein